MELDELRLDAQVREAVAALRRVGGDDLDDPLTGSDLHLEGYRRLFRSEDSPLDLGALALLLGPAGMVRGVAGSSPLLAALRAWVYALSWTRATWSAHVATARAWNEPVNISDSASLPTLASPRALRRGLLAGGSRPARWAHAAALARTCGKVGDAAQAELAQGLAAAERHRAAVHEMAGQEAPDHELEPFGGDAGAVDRLAEAVLAATDAPNEAEPGQDRRWPDTLYDALAPEAREGWPARLRPRWLTSVLRPARWITDPTMPMPPMPAALGAASYAAALGRFAVVALEHTRETPFCLHQHPFGARRHARFALFASMLAETSFATHVLGLGRDRAVDHRRAVARGMLVSLRITALQVQLGRIQARSVAEARERFEELAHRALGAAAPPALLGVLPRLRPTDPGRLVGYLEGACARRSMIERFDEDWFRNPRAVDHVRNQDCRADAPVALDDASRARLVDTAAADLAAAL